MAMQSGMGLSKVLIVAGAGYTSAVVMRNGKLSDLLGEIQALLKGLDKSGDELGSDSDAIASQVRRLANEVRQLATARPITVLNGSSSETGIASLILPAAVLGTLGYGYMWWKGLSLSDLMYVTKQNMRTAVASMTKHLEDVKSALAATKKHLSQRIENLDGKLDEQKEISKLIKNEDFNYFCSNFTSLQEANHVMKPIHIFGKVKDVRGDLSNIGYDLNMLQKLVDGLDDKINTLEDKQDFANNGVWHLCKFIGGGNEQMAEYLKSLPTPRRSYIDFEQTTNLKDFTKLIQSGPSDLTRGDGVVDRTPRPVTRMSIKC